MKNSIKTDIFLLNIYSLTNLSSFFNGKSISQNFFTCPYFSIVEKINPPVWAGNQPLDAEMHERLCGVQGPPGTGTVEQESQRGLVPSGTAADIVHKAAGFGGSSRLTFPSPSLSMWYRSIEVERGGRNMFVSDLPPTHAQILLTDRSSHVTL